MKQMEKELVDCCILKVTAATTGFCGGDAGHGGHTVVRFLDLSGFCFPDDYGGERVIECRGDSELENLILGFEFVAGALREMSGYKGTLEGRECTFDSCPTCEKEELSFEIKTVVKRRAERFEVNDLVNGCIFNGVLSKSSIKQPGTGIQGSVFTVISGAQQELRDRVGMCSLTGDGMGAINYFTGEFWVRFYPDLKIGDTIEVDYAFDSVEIAEGDKAK